MYNKHTSPLKRCLAVLLGALLLISISPAAVAEEPGVTVLKLNPYGGAEDAIDAVSWFSSNSARYLFLPADADMSAAKVYFTASGDVTLDGEPIFTGGNAAAFTVGAHTLQCGGKTYALQVQQSASIPAVFIETESGSLASIHADKEHKEKGSIRVYENGTLTLDKELKQIKGRGNASWNAPKKPYNIKFDKKTDLFGMGKAKKWTLLANYYDKTLVRNVYGWYFADRFGLDYSSAYRHVDLYINGEYLGNYVICESVEVGENRVDVPDLDAANEDANPGLDLETLPQRGTGASGAVQPGTVYDSAKWIEIPASPENITGGYLLEYDYADRYNAELCGFVTRTGQPVVIKSPELASEAEVRYIQAVVNAASDALYSETGFNAEGQHYSDIFDMDSLVSMYILQELSENTDAGLSSLFLYKDANSNKLVFSPVWDLDHAFGDKVDRFGVNISDPGIWWANGLGYRTPTVFNAAFRHADFRAAVREKWNELMRQNIFSQALEDVGALTETLAASAEMNLIRWNGAANAAAAASQFTSLVRVGKSFITARAQALTAGFSENTALLYYNANGGSGNVFHPEILTAGEAATLISYLRGENRLDPPTADHMFMGWNTAPDGNGQTYQPGDRMVLTSAVTTLYAVWKTQAELDAEQTEPTTEPPAQPEEPDAGGRSLWQLIVELFQRIAAFFRRIFGISA